jgi:hypothetical protein
VGDLKEQVIALLKDPSDFDTYDKQASAIISLARADALKEAASLFYGFGDDPFTAASIAAALRVIKDKPACG